MEINVNFISKEKLNGLSVSDKLDFILNEVKKGQILVLEKGLNADEQTQLIEMTMSLVTDEFPGIEMESYIDDRPSFLQKLFGKTSARMTVIGPAGTLKTVYKDKDVIQAVITEKR